MKLFEKVRFVTSLFSLGIFFGLYKVPNIFDNFVKLIQIKKWLENELFSVYLPFMAAGWKNLKNI